VGQDVTELDPVFHVDGEAPGNEVLELVRKSVEVGVDQGGSLDLGVCLEGDVAASHVVEEDSEGPDSEAVGFVPPVLDPLRWRVHPGSVEGSIDLVVDVGSTAEVN